MLSPADQLSSRGGWEGRGRHSIPGEHEVAGMLSVPVGNTGCSGNPNPGRGLDSDSGPKESAPENDGRVSSDARLLETTDQKRAKGENDPGGLETCATEHHPLGMLSVDLGRSQFNFGCRLCGRLDGHGSAEGSRGGCFSCSPAYRASADHCKIRTLSGVRLEKTMAAYSSTLAWKIPWTEEPGRL